MDAPFDLPADLVPAAARFLDGQELFDALAASGKQISGQTFYGPIKCGKRDKPLTVLFCIFNGGFEADTSTPLTMFGCVFRNENSPFALNLKI